MNLTIQHFKFTKTQRIGISILMGLIVLLEVAIYLISNQVRNTTTCTFPEEIIAFQQKIDSAKNTNVKQSYYQSSEFTLTKFNPNELTTADWIKMGFSEKQVNTILNYKNSLGGEFSTIQEIQNCYVISRKKFEEIRAYIDLPQISRNTKYAKVDNKNQIIQKTIYYQKFNPNDYLEKDWMKIGFTKNQSQSILKYKKSLGGNFTSAIQLKQSYVISKEKFEEMKPYLIFPKQELVSEIEHKTYRLKKFNPNTISEQDWIDMGFTQKQVRTILNYKNSLGGSFPNAETLKKCYSISTEKFIEIEPYMVFEE